MSLLWASALLLIALPFLLWPLLRHEEAAIEDGGVREHEELRRSVLLAIEEVELDEASGRLDPAEARLRLDELRGHAERILQRR